MRGIIIIYYIKTFKADHKEPLNTTAQTDRHHPKEIDQLKQWVVFQDVMLFLNTHRK